MLISNGFGQGGVTELIRYPSHGLADKTDCWCVTRPSNDKPMTDNVPSNGCYQSADVTSGVNSPRHTDGSSRVGQQSQPQSRQG